ncbi:MAG: hypothetical protein IPK91_06055 [Saprospiraceae bacterium]|nr:hypothetical protein [Saprospiraceae bacterium]
MNRILTKNTNNVLIPYSSAHLSDLLTSYKQSETGKIQTELDLLYLEKLTTNNCILYDYQSQSTYPFAYPINKYFAELLEGDSIKVGNFDNFLNYFSNKDLNDSLNASLDKLKLIPSGIDPDKYKLLPPKFDKFKDTFCLNKSNTNYYDLLKGSFDIIAGYHEDPDMYRQLRNAVLEEAGLLLDYSKCENPIKEISKRLKNSILNMTFEEFAENNIKSQFKNKKPSKFDIFTNHYILLDFLGYQRDKRMKNLIQDAFHAYYGAHCDFFVTDDKNTYHKSKALYEYFNIETIVCNTKEFIWTYFGIATLNINSHLSLGEAINNCLQTSLIIKQGLDGNLNQYVLHKLDYPILYFLTDFN